MASHGTSRHGRYERLLRKHRLDTRSDGDQETGDKLEDVVAKQKTTRSSNLHHEWVAIHEKRQQIEGPSTTVVFTNLQTTSTSSSFLSDTTTETTTQSDSEPTTTTAPETETAVTSDQETIELPSASEEAAQPLAATAITAVVSTVSSPSDTESVGTTTTTVPGVAAASTTDESIGTTTTTVPEAATSFTKEDQNTISASVETLTVATTDTLVESATLTSPLTESVSEFVSASLSESLSEVAGIIATLTSDAESTSTAAEELPPISTSTPIPATIPSASTSVPIISQPSRSSGSPISWGSSLDIPTAVVSVQTPTTSLLATIAGIVSGESSGSNSDTSTSLPSTNTTTTSTSPITSTTTATTTTSDTSHTTSSNNPSQNGFGWDESGSDTTAGASPESTGSSGSGSLSAETTGKIVGGVVGGVAGASFIFLLILLLLRRRKKTGFFFGSPARSIADDGGGGLIGGSFTRQMVSRDSNKDGTFGAAYFAPAFMKRWRQSQMSTGEESITSSAPSERGFQKISGRKLPSGTHPGFEYGGGGVEAGSPTESDLSATLPPMTTRHPPPSNPFSHPLDTSFTREVDDDVVVMRPSPARTPTAGSSNAMTWADASARAMPMSFPMPPSGLPVTIPKRPDALGRSHPSYDGSRGSRFTESL
ncbi:hypothetical protein BDW59DRAFT_21818 [Aspergillus cavernicola]|uniref:Mid2 domain-containing protein n=1 Tax=Aspergillus cavernicola TaxID=176166 RepID=A0ABR4HHJ4_9EURO